MAKILKAIIVSEEIVYLKPYEVIASETSGASNLPLNDTSIDTEITNPINRELREEELEKKREEGYQEGYALGIAEGEAKARAQLEVEAKALSTLVSSIPDAINEQRLQLSGEIADIVLAILQQYFINQQHNKESIGLQITQTISKLNDKQNLELALNPQDFALLQQGLITLDLKQCKNLRVIPDENLRLGGVIIKSEHGIFDASIERQIDNLKEVLLRIKHGEARE